MAVVLDIQYITQRKKSSLYRVYRDQGFVHKSSWTTYSCFQQTISEEQALYSPLILPSISNITASGRGNGFRELAPIHPIQGRPKLFYYL